MENWESWGIPLGVVAVLWGINSNLRGTITSVIESVLALALLVLPVVGIWVSGWVAGGVGFIAAMSLAGVAKSLSPLGPATPLKQRRAREALARELGAIQAANEKWLV